jgi:hypothetical protein
MVSPSHASIDGVELAAVLAGSRKRKMYSFSHKTNLGIALFL